MGEFKMPAIELSLVQRIGFEAYGRMRTKERLRGDERLQWMTEGRYVQMNPGFSRSISSGCVLTLIATIKQRSAKEQI
jgi:hypothetical protein